MFGDAVDWTKPVVNNPAVDLMNRRDAARFIGFSESHFSRCVVAGHLPQGFVLGRVRMWSKAGLTAYIYQRWQEAQQQAMERKSA